MTKDEALKMALEWYDSGHEIREEYEAMIKTILAQPEQEPVAWLIWLHGPAGHFDHKQFAEMEFERRNKEYPDPDRKLLPLYTAPPQPEPVIDKSAAIRIATALGWEPKRTWVGLTDEEAMQICVDCGCMSEDWLTLLDAIEAKLKEKNT